MGRLPQAFLGTGNILVRAIKSYSPPNSTI
jgi:hypothetical protein